MFLLTDDSGSGVIIDSRETLWKTSGEYLDDCFRIVDHSKTKGWKPVKVLSLGEAEMREVNTTKGKIKCNHFFSSAEVQEEEEEAEEGLPI